MRPSNWIRGALLTGGVTATAVGIADGPFWWWVIGAMALGVYQGMERI